METPDIKVAQIGVKAQAFAQSLVNDYFTHTLATATKGITRHQIEALLRKANRTAGSIAEENGTPEIMNQFRMPHGRGDETLMTRANSMADAIDELGLESEFERHGLVDFATTLRDAAQNFVVDSGSQGVAQSKQAGATKAIPGFIKSIKSAVKTLDALYHNFFDGDAETLGAWKTASHVEKTTVRNPRRKASAPAAAAA